MTEKLKSWWGESKTWHHIAIGVGIVVFLYLGVIFMVRLTHYSKIMPGIKVRGIYIGSLTKPEAIAKLNSLTSSYLDSTVGYQLNGQHVNIKPSQIGVSFDNKALVDTAFELGRNRDIISDIAVQTSLPFSDQDIMQINIDKDVFSQALVDISNSAATPAQNASYKIQDGAIAIIPSHVGQRMDVGVAILTVGWQMSQLKSQLDLPLYNISPTVSTTILERQKQSIDALTQKPIALSYQAKSWEIGRQQLLDWLYQPTISGPFRHDLLSQYYQISGQLNDLQIQPSLVASFLENLTSEINIPAIDAKLAISGGKAVVFKQSQDGKSLNIAQSSQAILSGISHRADQPLALVVDTKKADVSDDNINSLGIKELLSEGLTIFPGSSQNRLQNVRVGMNKFNGILVKPGQVFSFGEYMGEVGPEQGYAEGLIILDKRVEKAYGGGLCQVSSTAYRAALLAGLPIVERVNHAFAISYYTAPFGVPGVDATIYYPQVDMKFKNDTGKHILIQTEMIGTTLKFRFYGTKVKSGVIRGPFFVAGSGDDTKPSQTVFYRDVVDLAGNVSTTDTINTYYKSSLDFPTTV